MTQYAQQQRPDLGLPGWLIFLRIAQGALALLILILSAVAAAKYLGGSDPTYLVSPASTKENDGSGSRIVVLDTHVN
jgi:hypothetical protein